MDGKGYRNAANVLRDVLLQRGIVEAADLTAIGRTTHHPMIWDGF